MCWASGSELAEDIWDVIKKHIPRPLVVVSARGLSCQASRVNIFCFPCYKFIHNDVLFGL